MTQTCGTQTRLTSMPKHTNLTAVRNIHTHKYIYIDTQRTAEVKDGDGTAGWMKGGRDGVTEKQREEV